MSPFPSICLLHTEKRYIGIGRPFKQFDNDYGCAFMIFDGFGFTGRPG
ncbi:hypothetical protein V6667_00705 [Neisseria leonii]|uniref:Uncharacterized protein n=1 Tax=Neisseria leonii TaxID=2995413 RepID=A0A9X4E4E8_9NEIS|nr:hypothetical protein [Neisseria sp. 51.81]MDD9328560.1 hypothetical protein [Neisseria sp. 51.81]